MGTTPLNIHVADTVAINIKMGIAGSICVALFFIPLKISFNGRGENMADCISVNADVPRRIKWLEF